MHVIIPSTESQIDAAKVSQTLVDDHELFVMCPHDVQEFVRLVDAIRVSQHFDVLVRESEHTLRIGAVDGQRELDLFVNEYVDFNAFFLQEN